MSPSRDGLDLEATANAAARYEQACERMFRREARCRRRGELDQAALFHDLGLIAGHAAYAEMRDPTPKGLGA